MKRPLLLLFVALVIFSCKQEKLNFPLQSHFGYFPLEPGSWVVYDVDSILHLTDDDATNQPDTSIAAYHFQLKEVVDSDFTDGQGYHAYFVTRFKRLSDTLPWDFHSRWVSNLTELSAQRVEDNVRYVKLSFPISIDATWNGNAFNIYGPENYTYSEVHAPADIATMHFDSTVTVLQFQDFNLIHRIFKEERFANHIGLVYKQRDSLNINAISQITNGVEYRQVISSYGR